MNSLRKATNPNKNNKFTKKILTGSLLAVLSVAAFASSHREAPSITTTPKADGTDFYMFRSYETNRSDFITVIANYQPLQDGYGGPNYFSMDPNALYEIHIDNDGDAQEEITFQFNFKNTLRDIQLPIGTTNPPSVSIPLIQAGTVSALSDPNLNLTESYTMTVVRDGRRRSEEHTSELQSRSDLVCRLLLEKKKKKRKEKKRKQYIDNSTMKHKIYA